MLPSRIVREWDAGQVNRQEQLAGRVEHHIAAGSPFSVSLGHQFTIIDGVLAEEDVQALASLNIDSITWEPAHAALWRRLAADQYRVAILIRINCAIRQWAPIRPCFLTNRQAVAQVELLAAAIGLETLPGIETVGRFYDDTAAPKVFIRGHDDVHVVQVRQTRLIAHDAAGAVVGPDRAEEWEIKLPSRPPIQQEIRHHGCLAKLRQAPFRVKYIIALTRPGREIVIHEIIKSEERRRVEFFRYKAHPRLSRSAAIGVFVANKSIGYIR